MLDDKIEAWYVKSGKKIVIILLILIGVYFIGKFRILGLFAPFILAWIFASILNVIVTWANRRLRLARGIGTIISMLTILSGLLSLLAFVIGKLWEQIVAFASALPEETNQVITQMSIIEERFSDFFHKLPGGIAFTNLDSLVEKLMNGLSSFLTTAIPVAYDVVAKVPDIVLFVIVMFLSTFFMTKDYYKIKDFVKAQFSDTIVDKVVIMQKGVLQAIGGYIRTQLILMSITFTICLVGLNLLKSSYPLLLSVVIAIVDALPVFGSGTILIPWGIYHIIMGNYSMAVGLFSIYGIIFLARQIMEPRILSGQIGVYALVTIMSVYVGYRLFGFIGLILGPAVAVVLIMLQNVGALPKFKPVENKDKRGV